jgi:predicted anti-sigma-YlaC factor YlaD
MKCREFEARLESLLDGELDLATRQTSLRHARECAACSELLAAVGDPNREGVDASLGSVTAAVLEQTIGSACGRAREQLPDHADQTLDLVNRELVELHLAGCSDCRRLSATLVALRRELPKLAEAPLDERFTTEILAATVARQSRWKSWWLGHWSGWVQRPRFAMEAAYVGLLVVMLVLGAFSTPVAALPQKGLQVIQPAPEAPSVWTHTGEGLGTFWEWVASLFEKAEKEPTEESP